MFEKMPYAMKVLLANAASCRNYMRRYGREYEVFRVFLRRTAEWDSNEQERWQREKLIDLVRSARTGAKHYANLPTPKGEHLDDMLAAIPILEKMELKNNPNAFININERGSHKSSTSGTTGSPLTVEHSAKNTRQRFAILRDHLDRLDVPRRPRSVRLSGRLIAQPGQEIIRPWIHLWPAQQILISTYHLDSVHARRIVNKITRFKPHIIDGYPSAILDLMRLFSTRGPFPASLKAVITTAEPLDPTMRAELESISRTPVIEYYSASEGVPIIQECSEGVLHVRWQSGILEVRGKAGVSREGSGELVTTSFTQDRTPLIRYATGDMVEGLQVANQKLCRCGLRTPVVERIEGRQEDRVLTKEGQRIGMFSYRTMKELDGVDRAQIIQDAVDRFRILVELREGGAVEKVEKDARRQFEKVLGYPVDVNIIREEVIPRGENGKFRSVVCKI